MHMAHPSCAWRPPTTKSGRATRVDQLIEQAAAKSTNIPTPQNPSQAVAYLEQLAHVILADGQITRQEKKLLKRFSDHVGLASVDVKLAINRERKRSYQAAKKELRTGPTLVS